MGVGWTSVKAKAPRWNEGKKDKLLDMFSGFARAYLYVRRVSTGVRKSQARDLRGQASSAVLQVEANSSNIHITSLDISSMDQSVWRRAFPIVTRWIPAAVDQPGRRDMCVIS